MYICMHGEKLEIERSVDFVDCDLIVSFALGGGGGIQKWD